jgi:hypothetical protein
MRIQSLRGVFYDPGVASQAVSSLRERGMSEVEIHHEQPPGTNQQIAARDARFPILAFGVLAGGGLGVLLGFFLGLPSLAMPSAREDTARIVMTLIFFVLGPAVLGALSGGTLAALASAGSRNSSGRMRATPGVAAPAERIVVVVPVSDEATAEEARRLLYELKATTVEP